MSTSRFGLAALLALAFVLSACTGSTLPGFANPPDVDSGLDGGGSLDASDDDGGTE